jgi:hypothetical protein
MISLPPISAAAQEILAATEFLSGGRLTSPSDFVFSFAFPKNVT